MNKTQGNGCTKEEALSALKKAGEIMDHYDLSMSDVSIKNQDCVERDIAFHLKTGSPVESCLVPLANYCDVFIYTKQKYDNGFRKKYLGVYGFKKDVEVYEYLLDVICYSYYRCHREFKQSNDYKMSSDPGKTLTANFKNGFTKNGYSESDMHGPCFVGTYCRLLYKYMNFSVPFILFSLKEFKLDYSNEYFFT